MNNTQEPLKTKNKNNLTSINRIFDNAPPEAAVEVESCMLMLLLNKMQRMTVVPLEIYNMKHVK